MILLKDNMNRLINARENTGIKLLQVLLLQLVHSIYQDVLTTTVEIQGLWLTSMNNIQFGFKIVQSFNNLRIKKKFQWLIY